jgi:cytochrome c-type biogenesis protein CcmH/NrfG
MAKQSKKAEGQYVRKETFWLVTLLALSVGFFGGVMFGVFKSDTVQMPGRPAPAPTTATAPDNAGMVSALEKETQSNPGNLDAWISLGNAYFDSNQYQKSIWKLTQTMQMSGPIWVSCIVVTAILEKR